jgi:acyl carrier protein
MTGHVYTPGTPTAPLTPDELLALVTDVLAVICGQPADSLSRDTELDAIGADSLARVELAEQVEERLTVDVPGLHIADGDLAAFRTIGDACDYLGGRL